MEKILIMPIGKVKNNFKNIPPQKRNWGEITSKIIINRELSRCLDGIEKYSHVVIIYWMHKAKKSFGWEKGSFSHRNPNRPNPIGLTIAELLRREENTLTVRGLDAFDGSPVIDVKPYTGHPRDLISNFRSPDKF